MIHNIYYKIDGVWYYDYSCCAESDVLVGKRNVMCKSYDDVQKVIDNPKSIRFNCPKNLEIETDALTDKVIDKNFNFTP